MRRSPVASECVAQWRAERWRGVLLSLLAMVLAALAVTAGLNQLQRAIGQQEALNQAGQHVYVARPIVDGVRVPAGSCLDLATVPGVLRSGGFVTSGSGVLPKAPDGTVTVRGYAGEMPAILAGGAPEQAEAYVPSMVAAQIGLSAGETLVLVAEPGGALVGLIDIASRVPDPGAWILYPTAPVGGFTECWAEFMPDASGWAQPLMHTRLATDGADLLVQPLINVDELHQRPVDAYRERPTRLLGLLAGSFTALVLVLVTWFRRSEIALYRSVGMPIASTALILLVPALAYLAIGLVGGALSGLVLHGISHHLTEDHVQLALLQGIQFGGAGALVLTLSTVILSVGRISSHLRDRI